MKVTFSTGAVIDVAEGTRLADAARAAGVPIETPCGGMGVCGKCRATVRRDGGEPESVLACQYAVTCDVSVELRATDEGLSVTEGASRAMTADSGWAKRALPHLPTDRSAPDAAVPYAERISRAALAPHILRDIARMEDEGYAGDITGIFRDGELAGVVRGDGAGAVLGLAVDIGTTGVSFEVADLLTGEGAGRGSFLNPQYQYGGDVLSRASFCMEDAENISVLRVALLKKLSEQIGVIEERRGISRGDIRMMTAAGNTIMQHIFLGISPSSLTRYPYRAAELRAAEIEVPELGLAPSARAVTFPCVSSYVGGDIVAGMIATGSASEPGSRLFIDIGTNGEMVLKLGDRLYATSTAAGPALEGMNISCGTRAAAGAIESVKLEGGQIVCRTIGDEPPIGICGSGLIDLTAVLLDAGVLDPAGRIRRPDKSFEAAPGVVLTQRDVRQIQLAKGAISTGVRMLLAEAGGTESDIDEVWIAGSFGLHLSPDSVRRIGMIGDIGAEIKFLGNTSLEGARMALLDRSALARAEELRRRVVPVELSNRDDFQEMFVKELRF